MPTKRPAQPAPDADSRQLDLFQKLTRFPKPTTVRIRSRNGIEDVPLAEVRDWLAKHAERTKSGA